MTLNKEQVEKNIYWLLENSSPPVLYLTHKYLMKTGESQLNNLWQTVLDCPETREIFGKQEQDGSWCAGGSWALEPAGIPKNGYTAYTPKYNTTVWVLSILGDMGFTVEDKRIKKAFDYSMTHQLENGLFHRFSNSLKSKRRQIKTHSP